MIVSAEEKAVFSRYNDMYGHASILREACGIFDVRLRILGQLQHGWSLTTGVENDSLLPLYVWNDRSYDVAIKAGVGPQEVARIGAPYLYIPENKDTFRIPNSLLAFPSHTTPGHPLAQVDRFWGDYADWLAAIAKQHGFEQVTVSLHVNDYEDMGVVNQITRRGLKVFCAGQVWSPWTTSSAFLRRIRALIKQHNVITANCMHSAVFYAAYDGKPIFVGGPTGERAPVENNTEVFCYPTSDYAWIDRHFPGFCVEPNMARAHEEVGRQELGLRHKKDPCELWQLLKFGLDVQ